ncbi:MAG: anti-sigma factor [Actinomycetota bacterium]
MAQHVSDQLATFARHQLDAEAERHVRVHLQGCADCTAELRAIEALAVDEEPLSELERARLRDNVARSTRPATRASRRWPGIAAGLGAAALVALGVVLSHVSTGGSAASNSAANAPVEKSATGLNDSISNQGSAAGGSRAVGPPPTPLFEAHGPTDLSALKTEGARGPVFRAFATYYDSTDASRLELTLTKQLADQAASHSGISSQIQRCSHTVLASEKHPTLPAYAATTSIKDRPALVLGFAWTPQAKGPLDHYMFWAWRRKNCGIPLTYETGHVKP